MVQISKHIISLLSWSVISTTFLFVYSIITIRSVTGQTTTTNTNTNTSTGGNGSKYTGCIDTTISSTDATTVRIGNPTVVCIQIGNSAASWSAGVQYVRLNFNPDADEYSKFHIPNSYNDLVVNSNASVAFNGKTITVSAASSTALSLNRIYYDSSKGYVYPFLTAIISAKNGIIPSNGISWDDACVFCGGLGQGRCLENTFNFNGIQQNNTSAGQPTKSCYLTRKDCDAAIEKDKNSTLCDITLYVVWSGTDSTGNAFQSQSYRFSAFPPQNIADRFTQLIPTFGLTAESFDISNYIGFGGGGSNSTNTSTTTAPVAPVPAPTTTTTTTTAPAAFAPVTVPGTGTTRHERKLVDSYIERLIEQAKKYEIVSEIIGTSTSSSSATNTDEKEITVN